MRRVAWGIVVLWIVACVPAPVRAASILDVDRLATEAPRETSVMRQREREARDAGRTPKRDYRWVPLTRIAPILRRAVIASEDARFYQHGGLDVKEIQASAKANWKRGKIVRGGSTITQQLAKNLYLETSRTLLRKAEEALLAVELDRRLSKQRILEIYLNVIEWGDGIYGAEAASLHYFGVHASQVNAQQAALLTALIPSPRRDNPAKRPARLVRRYNTVLLRLRQGGAISRATYAELRNAPWQLAGTRPPRPVTPVLAAPVDSVRTDSVAPVLAPPDSVRADSSLGG